VKVPVELVLVNYNPLDDEQPFEKMIIWPVNHPCLSIRMITVPKETHMQHLQDGTNRMKLPVLEFIAKNVGIRRANAPYVLSTNADIIFDDRFFDWLKTKPLNPGFYYRADRYDFENATEQELLEGIPGSKIQRVYNRRGFYERKYFLPFVLYKRLILMYGVLRKLYYFFISGFPFLEKYRSVIPFFHSRELFLLNYHFYACGDFTLTAKANWEKLYGYPEDTYSAMHTDSLFLILCLASGLNESILPYPVYHQMHTNTFEHNASDFYKDKMFKRVVEASRYINGPLDPLITNSENWGMADKELSEIRLV